ncbi:NAD(P)H-binding protein [Paraconexibacter algicola]|uniref:NAD(P)H-binding protein n=1 Tax=Paraconexibacter algicola TaxID=2133960 RepID=UPI001304AD28|nr:NAD(P)H-binding protein [Paraconexibacter algicola]
MTPPLTILLTGATGYVGGQLLPVLLEAGHHVRCLVRDASPQRRSRFPEQVEVVEGDVLTGTGLDAALDGVDAAYYLVHSMGRGSGSTSSFADRDKRAADTFGRAAAQAGVDRVVYLGGLEGGDTEDSEHLRSRADTAVALRRHVPGVVHVRAAMVIGAGSASFEILSHLARRLPVMLTPRWVETRSQPVAIADVTATLARLATWEDPPAEVELGGADVLSYREMMRRFADVADRRPPTIVPIPVMTPRLSSYWVSLFTPIETGLVRPLVDGLSAETVVRRPPPAGLNDAPLGFDAAVRAALQEA